MPRAERAARQPPPTAQWTLFRQLATGGVLVGGLALTYFLIMGGKDNSAKAPPTADGPLVPAPVEPMVLTADSNIPSPEEPPSFDHHFNASPAPPSHLKVAERVDNKPEPTPPPMNDTRSPLDTRGAGPELNPRPEPNIPPRDDRFISRGRIGPDPVSVAAPRYPETDRERYPEIRPNDSPAARAADLRSYPDTSYTTPPRR
jgi:hypothetical protein